MPTVGGAGGVRVGVAFDDPTLEPTPAWTYLTATENLVAEYDITRGSESEFVPTERATATVRINDPDGILDPTNTSGPYYGLIEPLLQIQIELLNPVDDTWYTRFRGFIDELNYTVDPSGRITFLEIDCVGLFAVLAAIEMQPGQFGDSPPLQSIGQIYFAPAADTQTRQEQIYTNAGIDPAFYVSFTGTVAIQESTYAPSTSALEALQEPADAEIPTVANFFEDRFGRAVFHGRLAELDPEGTIAAGGPISDAVWDFHHWKAGDGTAVASAPSTTAHFRTLAFNRGTSLIYNSALCTPQGVTEQQLSDQDGFYKDAASIATFGIRSWSAEGLIIDSGNLTGNTAMEECQLYSQFIVLNNKSPKNRITEMTFRTMNPNHQGASALWALLCKADISDLIDVTATPESGTFFNLEPFVIRGVQEKARPLNGSYANVTLSLNVVPLPLDAAGLTTAT